MDTAKYDPTSPLSIYDYSMKLAGKRLADFVDMGTLPENLRNKGDLGLMVEKYYFGYEPNNSPEPDFPFAGVELKTTGVLIGPDGAYKAKERLVLMMIDYSQLIEEDWESCSLLRKCELLLIIFYLHDKQSSAYQLTFLPAPILFSFPSEDLEQIRLDWIKIRRKVIEGKAHELSEGDTFYLAACRKGSGGVNEPLRQQPNSEIRAQGRAFSLKAKYVDLILKGNRESTPHLQSSIKEGIEAAAISRLTTFSGQPVNEIAQNLNYFSKGLNHKAYYRELVLRMLGAGGKNIPELERAEIELKTVRIGPNGKAKESMSFPGFKYTEIVNETWEDSAFCHKLERKFLFAVFSEDSDGVLRFLKAGFWSMPFEDREEARLVWETTRENVIEGKADFPKASENEVAHVRPKARNAQDKIMTPQGTLEVKRCFWLNASYISKLVQRL